MADLHQGSAAAAKLVLLERLENLYQPRIESVASSLVVGFILAVALWRVYPWYLVLLWYAGIWAVQFGRGALFGSTRYKPVLQTEPLKWARGYMMDVAAAGLYWSISLAILAKPDDLLTHSFMAWALGGLAVGSITVHAYYPPVMYTFLSCLLLPFATRQLWQGDFAHVFLGLGLVLLGIYLVFFGRFHARTLELSIALRHENRHLISQLKMQRETALELKSIAESASQSKSRFFAAASHDLRQPLQALSLYASVLSDSKLPENSHQISIKVRDAVNVLEDLFEGMLDISRIEAGNILLQQEPVAVQQLMDRALLLFAGEALDKGISLKAVACSCRVTGDRVALHRIISNLVANAVRYTDAGRVVVGARRKGHNLRLLVIDTGPGIAFDSQARIFEEFYRLPDSQGHGFGLGLTTVKRLCDVAGYKLGFQSRVGTGSTFWLEIPLTSALLLPSELLKGT